MFDSSRVRATLKLLTQSEKGGSLCCHLSVPQNREMLMELGVGSSSNRLCPSGCARES